MDRITKSLQIYLKSANIQHQTLFNSDAVRRTNCRSTDCNPSGTKARKCSVIPSITR